MSLPLVIELDGSPRDRGRAHGETARHLVHEAIARWQDDIASATGLHPATFLQQFLIGTDFSSAIEQHTPELAQETAGIAEGAGADPDYVAALQLVDEVWIDVARLRKAARDEHEHCTALAIAEDGHVVIAQNNDLPAWYNGLQVLLRHAPTDDAPGMTVASTAGWIGAAGMNDLGVGVCVNALMGLPAARHGLPVTHVVRGVLAQTSLDGARNFVTDVQHASGQHYFLGGPSGAASYECGADAVRELTIPSTGLAHTNHPLATGEAARDSGSRATGSALANSEARLTYATAELQQAPLDEQRANQILRDVTTPLCRTANDGTNSVSAWHLVFECAPEPRAHIAAGPGVAPTVWGPVADTVAS